MPKITMWNGSVAQFANLDDANLTWQLSAPHPPANARTIQRAFGRIQKFAAPGGLWEFVLTGVDGSDNAISLGYSGSGAIPNDSGQWFRGWRISAKTLADWHPNQVRVYARMPHTIQWKTTPVVDPSQIWLGLFVSGSGTLPGAKAKFFAGAVWKIGTDSKIYLVCGNGGFLAAGAGGGLGVSVGILTGFDNIQSMKSYSKADYGIDVNIGAKWSAFVGLCNRGAQLTKALGPAFSALKKMEGAISLKELADLGKKWEDRAKAADAAKKLFDSARVKGALSEACNSSNTVEFAKTLLACLGVDGTSQGLEFIELGGTGLELSVYGGYTSVFYAAPL